MMYTCWLVDWLGRICNLRLKCGQRLLSGVHVLVGRLAGADL